MLQSIATKPFLEFWQSFSRDPLYETGFADAVSNCGANKQETWETEASASAALGYLIGYANAARLANAPHMSTRWQICNLLGIAAGIQLALLPGSDATGRGRCEKTESLCKCWTLELADLCVRLSASFTEASDEQLARAIAREH